MAITVPITPSYNVTVVGAASISVSLTGSMPTTGDAILVQVCMEAGTANTPVSADCDDDQSVSAYTLDHNSDAYDNSTGRYDLVAFWSRLNLASPPSDPLIITVVVDNPVSDLLMSVITARSLATASAVLATAKATGTDASAESGTTADIAPYTDALAIIAATMRNTVTGTIDKSADYTWAMSQADSAYTNGGSAYKILSATGTQGGTLTISGGSVTHWSAGIVVYKGPQAPEPAGGFTKWGARRPWPFHAGNAR